jgi:CubicO group peptidase (beta-lactamase class C family)
VKSPESQGLSTGDLAAAAAGANLQMGGRDCYLVVKNGYIVHETYYGNTQATSTRAGWSTTKSMCASLYGVAVQQGWAPQPVSNFVANKGFGTRQCNVAANFQNVLTMTGTSSNIDEPRFSYDTLGTQCLDTINDYIGSNNPEGLTTPAWKDKYWQEILGMEHQSWTGTLLNRNNLGCGFGAQTSCRDLARAAQLWANEGAWPGHGQIMDKEYAVNGRKYTYPTSGEEYGFTFWLNTKDTVDPENAHFNGMFAQCAYFSVEHNAVIVSMGDGSSCTPAWTNGRSAIVSNSHSRYNTTRGASKWTENDHRVNDEELMIQSAEVLALRPYMVAHKREFKQADLKQYDSWLVKMGGQSIFHHGDAGASASSGLVADGTCTDTADHTIWEATGKTNFTTDMRTWYVCVCKTKTCLYLLCLTSLIFAFHSQRCTVHW